MEPFVCVVAALTAFLVGLAIGIDATTKRWNAICERSSMNVDRYRLMFFEASERYWRTRAALVEARGHANLVAACVEAADGYKRDADDLRPKVTPV